MLVTLLGITRLRKDLQSSNALSQIIFVPSFMALQALGMKHFLVVLLWLVLLFQTVLPALEMVHLPIVVR
jgi:hypothetical protein